MPELQSDKVTETAYSWVVVIASLVISSLSFGAVTLVPILMKPMVDDLGWARSVMVLAHALAMIAAGFAGAWFGRVADRQGFFKLSLIAGLAICAGLWLSSTAQSPLALYLPYALLVGGIGQGIFFGPITAAVSHWFDRNRSLAMSIAMCGQSVGGLTVPVILRLSAQEWGWRNAMMSYGLFCGVVVGLLSLVYIRKPPERIDPKAQDAVSDETESSGNLRYFYTITFALALTNSGSFVVIAHLVALAEEQHLTPLIAAMLLTLTLGVTLFSRLAAGALLDRNYPGTVLYVSSISIPAGIAALGLAHGNVSAMVIGLIFFGLGYGGIFPAYISFVRSTFASTAAGKWISTIFLFGFLAAALGSWTGGVLRDLNGNYDLALRVAWMLTSLGFVVTLFGFGGPLRVFRKTHVLAK